MPRPTNKIELLDAAKNNYQKLLKQINTIPRWQQAQTFKVDDRDKCIRDIICHLYEWHQMMNNWYIVGMGGDKPKIPKEGYTWKTLPDLNYQIWKEYQDTNLDLAFNLFNDSHEHMIELIDNHTDKELFTPSFYKWTGSTTLGAYFISATSSHYDWAIKKVKAIAKIALAQK